MGIIAKIAYFYKGGGNYRLTLTDSFLCIHAARAAFQVAAPLCFLSTNV